jgi:hypothetical protein
MKDIVVEVNKGMVVGIYSDIEDARFIVVDWDLLERADARGQFGTVHERSTLSSLSPRAKDEYHTALYS